MSDPELIDGRRVDDAVSGEYMYDTIVVGAQCAGSSLAMLLARRGARVLLVDRATFPADIPQANSSIDTAREGYATGACCQRSPPERQRSRP